MSRDVSESDPPAGRFSTAELQPQHMIYSFKFENWFKNVAQLGELLASAYKALCSSPLHCKTVKVKMELTMSLLFLPVTTNGFVGVLI